MMSDEGRKEGDTVPSVTEQQTITQQQHHRTTIVTTAADTENQFALSVVVRILDTRTKKTLGPID